MDPKAGTKAGFAVLAAGLAAVIGIGLFWFFVAGPSSPVGFGWYFFSFAAGLTMIVLPCTLPLAFVIVPLSMGKGAGKGFGIAIAFGLGVAITLSLYGVAAAVVGEIAIGTLGAPLETVKNWLYFIAGLLAYIFAFGETGLWKLRMPSYTGAVPSFIHKRQDIARAFSLGLFLGNIGVGCPHPATPVILTRIAASGDVFYGWLLFFVHAAGRVLPLLLLALLAILGVNALAWLVSRREKVERASGWGMIYVAAFILVLGLFGHDWWVASGQHTLLEEITQEEKFLGLVSERLGVSPPHTHGLPTGTGLFGLPLWLGNWVLTGLFVLPLWWHYAFRRPREQSAGAEKEAIIRPYRFWLYASLTALFALTFIWVMPDRFLNHTLHKEGEMNEMVHSGDGHMSLYHEEGEVKAGLAVNLNAPSLPIITGSSSGFYLFVNEKPGNVPVGVGELELNHGRIRHLVGVRSDMEEFFHIHPAPTSTPGMLAVEHVFAKPGRYKMWSEIRKGGMGHVFGHPEFHVSGSGEPHGKNVSFARSVMVDGYQVLLTSEEPVAEGHEHDLIFNIHTSFGGEVALEDYLESAMHLTIIRDDWKHFIHTHPDEGAGTVGFNLFPAASAHGEEPAVEADAGDGVSFRVMFPEAGTYKLFAQFRPLGSSLPPDSALLAEFWVRVDESKPFAGGQVMLVVSSLVIMTILGAAVKKYLGADAA